MSTVQAAQNGRRQQMEAEGVWQDEGRCSRDAVCGSEGTVSMSKTGSDGSMTVTGGNIAIENL